MDHVFDTITYSSELVEAWSAFDIIRKAYGNLHVIDHLEGSELIITRPHLAGKRDDIFLAGYPPLCTLIRR